MATNKQLIGRSCSIHFLWSWLTQLMTIGSDLPALFPTLQTKQSQTAVPFFKVLASGDFLGKSTAPTSYVHYHTRASPGLLPLRLNSSRNHRKNILSLVQKVCFIMQAANASPYEDLMLSFFFQWDFFSYFWIRDTWVVAAVVSFDSKMVYFILYHLV